MRECDFPTLDCWLRYSATDFKWIKSYQLETQCFHLPTQQLPSRISSQLYVKNICHVMSLCIYICIYIYITVVYRHVTPASQSQERGGWAEIGQRAAIFWMYKLSPPPTLLQSRGDKLLSPYRIANNASKRSPALLQLYGMFIIRYPFNKAQPLWSYNTWQW